MISYLLRSTFSTRNVGLAIAAALLFMTTACNIDVQKNKDGQDKNVKVDTPFGGIHVTQNGVSAADTGLPQYPGAHLDTDREHDKSADIHMGFGDWQLRIKVVRYNTSDPSDKVLAFYKKALGRYGDVIDCNGKSPVGTPTITREGLTCEDSSSHGAVHLNQSDEQKAENGHYLKAGSKRHQHIMGIESGDRNGPTSFSLVQIDLPTESGSGETN